MRSASQFALVLVTAPDARTARTIAKAALKARLIACANIIPSLESIYWWNNKIETGREVLILLKTTQSHLAGLEKLVVDHHPYDTPEFLVLNISRGNKRYLDWMLNCSR
jgi:periplasmic divalent cation tolerance protein